MQERRRNSMFGSVNSTAMDLNSGKNMNIASLMTRDNRMSTHEDQQRMRAADVINFADFGSILSSKQDTISDNGRQGQQDQMSQT